MIDDEQMEAAKHRSDRFIARLSGKQEGSTAIAAQQSALDVPDLLALVERMWPVFAAAQVWHVVRRDKVSGDVFHRGCKALDEAVRASNGTLGREPIAPPSEEEIERGRDIVRRAKAYSERCNAELFGRDEPRGNSPVEPPADADLVGCGPTHPRYPHGCQQPATEE